MASPLGEPSCSEFSQRMIVSVANGITTSLNNDLSSVETVAALRDRYNERERQYAHYRKFVPDGDESPKGTLFWEFSKIVLQGFTDSDDILDLMRVRESLTMVTVPFLKKTNEVLST